MQTTELIKAYRDQSERRRKATERRRRERDAKRGIVRTDARDATHGQEERETRRRTRRNYATAYYRERNEERRQERDAQRKRAKRGKLKFYAENAALIESAREENREYVGRIATAMQHDVPYAFRKPDADEWVILADGEIELRHGVEYGSSVAVIRSRAWKRYGVVLDVATVDTILNEASLRFIAEPYSRSKTGFFRSPWRRHLFIALARECEGVVLNQYADSQALQDVLAYRDRTAVDLLSRSQLAALVNRCREAVRDVPAAADYIDWKLGKAADYATNAERQASYRAFLAELPRLIRDIENDERVYVRQCDIETHGKGRVRFRHGYGQSEKSAILENDCRLSQLRERKESQK